MNEFHLWTLLMGLIFIPFLSHQAIGQETIIDSLEQALAQAIDPKEKTDILIDLSYYNVRTDAGKAELHAEEALSLSKKENYGKGVRQSYIQLAGIQATIGKLNKALEMLDAGEHLAIAEKDTNEILTFYRLRASYHGMLGNLDEAFTISLKHLQLSEKINDEEEKGQALLTLGYLNGDQGRQDYSKSLDYFQEASKLFERIKDEEYLALSLLNVSAIYEQLEDFEKSIKVAERALEISKKNGQKDWLVSLYSILGKNYYELNRKQIAIDYLERAVNLSKEMSNINEHCKWTLKLAQYHNEFGSHDKALFYLKEVKELIGKLDRIIYYQPYYEQLAIAQKAKGFYDAAFENLELSMSWKDSSYQELKLKEFEEIQTKYLVNQIPLQAKVLADHNALATIVRNLVGNAIKYTEKGGEVTVSTKDLVDKTFIEINDTGTGISAQRMEKLFEIGKKKISKGTAGEKGSGLGLMLVKELVEINKGGIEVFSDLEKGTTVTFSMPRIH